MDKGCTIQELSRGPVLPRIREDTFDITMEITITMKEVRTTVVAPRMGMVMEEATDRTVPTQQRPPRRIYVKLLVSSAGRMDITPRSVLKQIMEMSMEVLGRSRTLSTGDR